MEKKQINDLTDEDINPLGQKVEDEFFSREIPNKTIEKEPTISQRQLKLKIALEIFLLAVITFSFDIILINLIENSADKFALIGFDIIINTEFVIFLGVAVFIALIVFCIKKQDKIMLKAMVTLAIFSLLCAFSLLIFDKMVYIISVVLMLAVAVFSVIIINKENRKIFIPIMAILLLCTYFNGFQQLFCDSSVEFSADYFYISSYPMTKINERANDHYTGRYFSSDILSSVEFSNDNCIITSYEQFNSMFSDNAASGTMIEYDRENSELVMLISSMVKATKKYDEKFFEEYAVIPYCITSPYLNIAVGTKAVAFNGTKSKLKLDLYTTDKTESQETKTVCICLIAIKKSDNQSLLSEFRQHGNLITGGNDKINIVQIDSREEVGGR